MARLSADLDTPLNGKPTGLRRSDRFLAGLQDAPRVTFVSHVQPDPDSLGSMLGLAHLVETSSALPTRLTRDGLISRAENRAMVELLDLDLVPVEDVTFEPGEAVVMVDSQPNTGRHTFGDVPLYAVIDHHTTPGDLDDVPFVDVRPALGATCSLVTRYLIEQDVPIPARVATALLYGIETEVSGYPREATHMDDGALHFLFPLADKDVLAQIRNARLPHSHFEVLAPGAAEFVHLRPADHQLGERPAAAGAGGRGGRFHDPLREGRLGRVRRRLRGQADPVGATSLHGVQAGELLRQVVGGIGKAGGHDRRAGGFVRLPDDSEAVDEVQAEIRRRMLKALGCEDARGQRLVPLREMLENLQG